MGASAGIMIAKDEPVFADVEHYRGWPPHAVEVCLEKRALPSGSEGARRCPAFATCVPRTPRPCRRCKNHRRRVSARRYLSLRQRLQTNMDGKIEVTFEKGDEGANFFGLTLESLVEGVRAPGGQTEPRGAPETRRGVESVLLTTPSRFWRHSR